MQQKQRFCLRFWEATFSFILGKSLNNGKISIKYTQLGNNDHLLIENEFDTVILMGKRELVALLSLSS